MVMLPARKNLAVGVYNYPREIQEEYFKTHPRVETEPLSKRVVLVKSAGILFFVIVLALGGWLCGARGFWQGFGYAVLMFALVGAYDTFFLDWVLFARMKMFRLPGQGSPPHRDAKVDVGVAGQIGQGIEDELPSAVDVLLRAHFEYSRRRPASSTRLCSCRDWRNRII